jgi:hypothetical protein
MRTRMEREMIAWEEINGEETAGWVILLLHIRELWPWIAGYGSRRGGGGVGGGGVK